ncbi:Phosphorylase b kinase beta regulatory chain isoform 1-like protein [Camelus ferus]|nr:Phosphorylase b kinase beta regulatory chain isoform 1-like protein [Camelus ferus]
MLAQWLLDCRAVKSTLLLYQSPTTGLFPTKTCGDDQKAKVHDSLYCAAGAWALALAYRRIDDDKGRTHELEHSAIKCMRGILYCYMRQADKVQQFKQDPRPTTCLHSAFNVHTGDEILSYEEYGHLQINAVSLYLLYLVEMISSGLQIIYNTDEVSFIQNLVFCVERVYRVPDFGVWERGSKYNNGSTELHSSSVGLAKAALEAINGFNLFGNQNTDAALLPCISYPAFALDDEVLFNQTLDKVVRKLKGKYGFKRFLRDGYRTSLEDPNRRYYKPAEIKLFDGIECEFPIFFLYMMIDGVFRGNLKQVKEYQDLLTPVLHHTTEGYPVIPKYYYVPADFVENEKKKPGSQKRFPSNCGRDGKLFLWGQALYVIAKLLADELISPKDIDPVHRYVSLQNQRNVSMRFSNQGPLENDLVVYVALIAESQRYEIQMGVGVNIKDHDQCQCCLVCSFEKLMQIDYGDSQSRLQVFLNTYGIQTQTPQQVEPIQIWAQQELVKNALQFIKQYWKMHGRPLFLVLIREDNIRGSRFNPILDMLAAFKKGIVGGVKVHVDRLQTLISGAVVEQLDFLRISDTEELPEFKSFEELQVPKHSKVKRQSSTSNAPEREQQPDVAVTEWRNKPTHEIIQKLNPHTLLLFWYMGNRSVVRHAASLLSKLVDSLAPSITNVLVQGKQVTLGAFGHEEEVISNPLSPRVIKNIIYYKCNTNDEREAVLQQELVIHIGWIISNNPELFSGMLKIRIGWIIHAMEYELQIRGGNKPARDLYQLSPSEVKQLLLDILQPQQSGRCWLNRRQIDGSLNRTPPGFYDRVWQILERTPNGIIVAGKHLPQLLMVVSIVLERNPELEFQDKVDLDKLVKEAFHEFQKDESRLKEVEKQDDMTSFYNTPPLGRRGTCSYLTKAVMNSLLEGEVKPSNDDPCLVS